MELGVRDTFKTAGNNYNQDNEMIEISDMVLFLFYLVLIKYLILFSKMMKQINGIERLL